MSENRSTRFVFYCLLAALGFCLSTTAVNGADILFISAMDPAMMPGDDALKAFMESLGHTVTYFDDNESEAATEAAAAAADLVFISESVGSGNIRNEITEIQTPMIITEAWGWDEMGLTSGGGAGQDVISTDIQIVAPKHVLAAGLSGTVPVLTDIAGDRGPARLGNGIAGREATVIARATLTDGQTYDVLFIYEKGAALPVAPADGSAQVAADMRICLGFDEHSYLLWNENAYALLRAAIRYALGMIPQARSPYPLDGAIVLATWTELRWSPGDFAATHDVYLGEDFDDVNNGAPETFRGSQATMSLLVGFPGYPYPDGLVPGTTYYWRIDEVNDADPNSPWKGPVWSFSIPPRTAYNPNPTDG
ncbi:MAG TPA: fibronectin type III domain-containing protein, partial [Sedimentisphaerales bacterium]|nr:fibronectin type III domain-containing protein [Sedimentisphaerales bacterium]